MACTEHLGLWHPHHTPLTLTPLQYLTVVCCCFHPAVKWTHTMILVCRVGNAVMNGRSSWTRGALRVSSLALVGSLTARAASHSSVRGIAAITWQALAPAHLHIHFCMFLANALAYVSGCLVFASNRRSRGASRALNISDLVLISTAAALRALNKSSRISSISLFALAGPYVWLNLLGYWIQTHLIHLLGILRAKAIRNIRC